MLNLILAAAMHAKERRQKVMASVQQPNAGTPKLVEDKTLFDMAPGPFVEGMGACIRAGAQIVGGCCGTTPDHIKALHEFIETM